MTMIDICETLEGVSRKMIGEKCSLGFCMQTISHIHSKLFCVHIFMYVVDALSQIIKHDSKRVLKSFY